MLEKVGDGMYELLLVEDDATIAEGLIYALEKEGYHASLCRCIGEAKKSIKEHAYDLAILDMQLPDGNAWELTTELNEKKTDIIFLTIVDEEKDIVLAFEEGAVDYITKPFRLGELLARIKRTLKARGSESNSKCIKIGEVRIETEAGRVFAKGEEVELTALEYQLLLMFAENRNILLTRNQILNYIWDNSGNFVEDNTLTVYVKRLREKLGTAINIETVRGVGYRVD